ncbi:tetratricopeptide repeat-containing sensor histidine kinase [Flavobacterium cucumis]|uniref:Signal transduction histidine kinase n=1 Tax=Flavobacterium cucumis TaxID=416016 RepID=A0A1M7ZUJ0_9FLAO|nr:tetratricopeptide repeat-containing sensor histidine kinase [Flavobacterium cucumis]SHO72532.1 Signal transduction histidine kinase [Flavobacterium cucumis]
MNKFISFLVLIFLLGCNSDKKSVDEKKRLDVFFTKSSDINLDKSLRLKYLDSIIHINEKIKNNDSLVIINYFKIANRFFMLLEYDRYKETTDKILELSRLNKDSVNMAKAEYYKGDYFFSTSQNDSAYYYYLAAEKKYEKTEDRVSLANTILHKAYILSYEKDFIGSESETIKVLSIAKTIGDDYLIYEAYTNLGSSLAGLENYEKALEYHKKALSQVDKLDDENYKPLLQAQALNNIGFAYLSSSNFKEASTFFSEGLKIENLKEIQPVLFSSLLDHYAYSRFKMNHKEGLKDFETALQVRDDINDVYGKINSRIHLTEYYLSKRDTAKALQFNQEANLLAKESSYNKEVLITLDFFTRLLPKQGLEYARAYIKLNDSLQNQERATRNKLARIAFETDEIIVEKEALSTQKKIILLTSLFIISLGVLLYIILYQRGKQKELLFEQEQQKVNEEIYTLMLKKQHEIDFARENEKLKIARDLHDNVLNKLASTRLNLFPLSKRQDEETIQKAIGQINGIINIESEIRLISHELAKEEFLNRNNFKTLVEELMENQKATYSVACEYDITDHEALENIGSAIKMHLYRIIQETLNNINKHANATKITVELYIQKEKLYLEIADNGVGFNVDKAKKGIGLKNIYMRTKEINGRIDVVSEKNKGTKITVKVRI